MNERVFRRLVPPALQDCAVRYGKRLVGSRFILIACMPKSGSTYLSGTLGRLPGYAKRAAVPDYGRREQELDRAQLRDLAAIRKNTVYAHHVRTSAHTSELLAEYPFHLVVLTRNLLDTCVSMEDHLDELSTIWPMAYLDAEQLTTFDDDKKLSFIVDLMVPWYVNFFVGWTEYERAGGVVQWVRYENMIAAPVDTMQSTEEGAGLKADPGAIQGAIATPKFDRFNIGVTGRGTRAFENRPTDLAKI